MVEADLNGLEMSKDEFEDLTHLNPLGASRFSRILARSVLLPLMAE